VPDVAGAAGACSEVGCAIARVLSAAQINKQMAQVDRRKG